MIDHISTLKKSGLKVTPHRIAIYRLLSAVHTPLSIKAIHQKLQKTGIDHATVYRTLLSFVRAGLVKQIDLQDEHTYFELVDEHDHHHVVCKKCKTIADFTGCGIDSVISKALKQTGFSAIENHSLELFGMCKKCTS
jgi:Fe2+ or Zn2+ uptake regulation protein